MSLPTVEPQAPASETSARESKARRRRQHKKKQKTKSLAKLLLFSVLCVIIGVCLAHYLNS